MASFQTILGTDGVAPYYNPTDRWTMWSIKEIFTGKEGKNKYVPKIDDYVVDPVSFSVYIVTGINFTTYLASMTQISISNPISLINGVDKILSPTTTSTSNTYRVYYDNSVNPPSLSVDARLVIYSNRATYAKLFKGVGVMDVNSSVSVYYDNSGVAVSDSIPLGQISYNNDNNFYTKLIPTFYTNYNFVNGDQVTIVIYDANGAVVSTQVMVVMVVTGYVQATGPKKYIMSIGLESSYNSDTLDDTIMVPSNLTVRQLAITGVVNYSDGSSKFVDISPVSGFSVYGLDQFDNKQYNTPMTVVLKYQMQSDEGAVGNLTYDNRCVSGKFSLVSTPGYVSALFGLYGYPVWINDTSGYGVLWYLMSGSRNVFYNVTDSVSYSSNGNVDGLNYNNRQLTYVSINSSDASSSLPSIYVSSQVAFTFNSPGNLITSPFLVYERAATMPDKSYGLLMRVKALDNSYRNFDFTFGTQDFTTWLGMAFYNTLPIVNSSVESVAPTPTHFEVMYNPTRPTLNISSWADQLVSVRFEISKWNTPIYIPSTLFTNATIIIKFLTISGTSNSILGACSVTIQ